MPLLPIAGVVAGLGLAGATVAALLLSGVIAGGVGGTNGIVGGTQTPISSPGVGGGTSPGTRAEGKIAFTCGGTYVVNADGSGLTEIADISGGPPTWSPDGVHLAFQFIDKVWVVNADGSGRNELGFGHSPAWSPDGRRIAYTYGGYPDDIYVVNPDGSDDKRLTTGGGYAPAWSPDGAHILFRDGRNGEYVMNADGSSQTRLAGIAGGTGLTWSPDGKKIALATDVVEVVNVDGSGLTRLAAGDSPTWSPDGDRIVFVRGEDRDHGGEVYVMNADGSGQTRLAADGARSPTWSPDGSHIAFASDHPSLRESGLMVMNADGSGATRVTRGLESYHCTDAVWFSGPARVTPAPTTASPPSMTPQGAQTRDLPCASEGTVRSMAGTPTRFAVTNRTDETITVYWLNFNGEREKYFEVRPGATQEQGTFDTHPWLITDTAGACLRIFYAPGNIVIDQAAVASPTQTPSGGSGY